VEKEINERLKARCFQSDGENIRDVVVKRGKERREADRRLRTGRRCYYSLSWVRPPPLG